LTMAAKCDSPAQHPSGTRTVSHKRQPCGNDHVCQQGEVNCWQLQYSVTPGHKIEFECVSKEVWDKTKIGDRG
jgi:hypothetical protein